VIAPGVVATADCVALTAAGVTVTVAVWVMATPLIVAETVLAVATVELSVPVATPDVFVVPVGCVRVFPVPVAASTTVAPLTGFPPASRAVTVMVLVTLPFEAVIVEGPATTVDCVPETAPTVMSKAALVAGVGGEPPPPWRDATSV
jgi:hypothetical protein